MGAGVEPVATRGSTRSPDRLARQRGAAAPAWDSGPAWQSATRDSRWPSPDTQPASRFTLTGLGAVAFVFVITLVVATLESLLGIGLRTFTLIALSVSTLFAGLWVRRQDLATVVVAPPLVFALVAALEIVLAPTLNLNVAVIATLLVRGFPAMAIAAAIALLVCGYRRIRHR